ncbi:hypothetical protein HDE_00631 [Halotydeus destructor]|nr:hypothetical protein HDE_00631 [Halotydeus destructor]
MEIKEVFHWLDSSLFFYGSKLWSGSWKTKTVEYVIRVVIYFHVAVELYSVCDELNIAEGARQSSMNLPPMIVQILLITKRSTIVCLLDQLGPHLSIENKLKIRAASKKYVAGYLFLSLILVWHVVLISEGYESIIVDAKVPIGRGLYPLNIILATFVFIFRVFWKHHWVLISTSIYCLVLETWSMANNSLLLQAQSTQVDLDDLISLIEKKQNINDLKDRFNQAFQIFPCMFLGSMFLESTGLLLTIQKTGLHEGWMKLSIYGINIALSCYLIIFTEHVQGNEKKTNQLIVRHCWPQLQHHQPNLVAHFKDTFKHSVRLSAIFFELNYAVILAFIHGLISFTVMFYQLLSSEFQPVMGRIAVANQTLVIENTLQT